MPRSWSSGALPALLRRRLTRSCSQFTSFLDLVEDVMTRSPQLSTTFLRLDGSMPLKQRAANLSQVHGSSLVLFASSR